MEFLSINIISNFLYTLLANVFCSIYGFLKSIPNIILSKYSITRINILDINLFSDISSQNLIIKFFFSVGFLFAVLLFVWGLLEKLDDN